MTHDQPTPHFMHLPGWSPMSATPFTPLPGCAQCSEQTPGGRGSSRDDLAREVAREWQVLRAGHHFSLNAPSLAETLDRLVAGYGETP